MKKVKPNQGSARTVTRRQALKLGAAGVASLGVGSAAGAPAIGGESRPNVLLIVTDQQHRDTIAATGCPHVVTPGQDRLCGRGVAFRHSYSSNPICSPARSSIFTGRAASETGVFENGRGIHRSIPNLGQWLSDRAGYDTVYTGKWHVPGGRTHKIPGFDVPITGLGGQGNLCDTSVSLGCEGFLRNRRGRKPFCLVASFLQPHDICQWLRTNQANVDQLRYPEIADELPPLPDNFAPGPDESAAVRERRQRNEPGTGRWSKLHWRYYLWSYYRMIEQVDAEIARVHRALEESGQAENTLVILVSDHGEGLARHQMVRKNLLYDEAAAVPFLVSFPGQVASGVTNNTHPVSQLDIVPTICDYAGVDAPAKQCGRSLRPLLDGRPDWNREYVVTEISASGHFARMVRTDRYKYIKYADHPGEQLFDMLADPGETRNLAPRAESASELNAHRKLLDTWESHLTLAPNLPEDRVWRSTG